MSFKDTLRHKYAVTSGKVIPFSGSPERLSKREEDEFAKGDTYLVLPMKKVKEDVAEVEKLYGKFKGKLWATAVPAQLKPGSSFQLYVADSSQSEDDEDDYKVDDAFINKLKSLSDLEG